jgi:hypothetical protein
MPRKKRGTQYTLAVQYRGGDVYWVTRFHKGVYARLRRAMGDDHGEDVWRALLYGAFFKSSYDHTKSLPAFGRWQSRQTPAGTLSFH